MTLSTLLRPGDRARLQGLERHLTEKSERRARRAAHARRGGLVSFIEYFWDVLEPQTTMVTGWPLEAICAHLEAITFAEFEPPRLLENVPPGFMKSLVTNVFWPAWEWGPMNLPHLRYVAFSYSVDLTLRDNRRFLALLRSPKYQALYANRFALVKAGEELVSNDKTGWKLASSVGGVGTGERGNRVLVDDPHNVKDQESDKIRGATVLWFQESVQSRLNDLKNDAIIVIMQRVHESDISGAIIDGMPEYTHLCIPMQYEEGRHCETQIGWSDPRSQDGEMAWPARFAPRELEVFKRLPYLWAGQYQQRPEPRGGGIFKREWWQLWEGPTFPAFDYVVASLDPAFTQKEENDPSGFTVWGVFTEPPSRQPRVMLVRAWRKRLAMHGEAPVRQRGESTVAFLRRCRPNWGLVEWVAESCRFRGADGSVISTVDRLLIEPKGSGITAAQEMQRLYGYEGWTTQVEPVVGDKVARAHAVVPAWSCGLVYAPDRDWAGMVIDEMSVFPKARHDDLTDSATQAIKHLRSLSLLRHADEIAADDREGSQHRPALAPLYDV